MLETPTWRANPKWGEELGYSVEEIVNFNKNIVQVLKSIKSENETETTKIILGGVIGLVRAAKAKNVNVAISFTVETDSKLGCGIEIQNFITTVDERSAGGPLYYQINCAHLSHFSETLISNHSQPWIRRILSLSPNASRKSHEELNNSTCLDDGNPEEFGHDLRQVKEHLPHLRIFGGCCGTDLRHIEKVCESCFSDRLTQ